MDGGLRGAALGAQLVMFEDIPEPGNSCWPGGAGPSVAYILVQVTPLKRLCIPLVVRHFTLCRFPIRARSRPWRKSMLLTDRAKRGKVSYPDGLVSLLLLLLLHILMSSNHPI